MAGKKASSKKSKKSKAKKAGKGRTATIQSRGRSKLAAAVKTRKKK